MLFRSLRNDETIDKTTVEQLVKSRRGQGVFKSRVEKIEPKCRVTGTQERRHLIASHIKPWRVSNNQERLDGNNGLMLSPHVDHLFDRGFISFKNNGDLLISSVVNIDMLHSWGIFISNVGVFNKKQCEYLEYHRENILK